MTVLSEADGSGGRKGGRSRDGAWRRGTSEVQQAEIEREKAQMYIFCKQYWKSVLCYFIKQSAAAEAGRGKVRGAYSTTNVIGKLY